MKQLKKMILAIMCVGVILGAVGCGNTGMDDQNNDVTQGTDQNNQDDGLMDDVGDAVGDGMRDVGEGVRDMTDDITGNNR